MAPDREFERKIAEALIGISTVVVGRKRLRYLEMLVAELRSASRDGRIDAQTYDAIEGDVLQRVMKED